MRRRTSTFISLLLLFSCFVAALAWVRSYLPEDLSLRLVDGRLLLVASEGHATEYLRTYLDPQTKNHQSAYLMLHEAANGTFGEYVYRTPRQRSFLPIVSSQWHHFGVDCYKGVYGMGRVVLLTVPTWYFLLFALLLTIVWLPWQTYRAGRRRRRAERGKCLNCGYDLRASTGRCPECGTPVTARQSDRAAVATAPVSAPRDRP